MRAHRRLSTAEHDLRCKQRHDVGSAHTRLCEPFKLFAIFMK